MNNCSLLNWNIMHGRNRKSATMPPCIGKKEIENNLEKIAACIKGYDPDILTLQEIDSFSVLSGGVNQYEFLRERLGYPYGYYAPSCEGIIVGKEVFVSGNALFSRYPIENCESYKFDFTFPTDRMGFVAADVKIPGRDPIMVISVHLVWRDWLRRSSRSQELNQVKEVIKKRKKKSVLVAGDFNCDYCGKEESLRVFCDDLNMHPHAANKVGQETYPSWDPKRRIDWVLASKDIILEEYSSPKENLSDHLPVRVYCKW